jgi:prepilin-type N-terminal cleavage/methylation domain-containing protein
MMKTNRGFTLIELLVVIAIIGILSSVVLASLNTARQKSRDARRISDIKQLQLALELYFDDNGIYPATIASSTLTSDYIPAVPEDPTATAGAYTYVQVGSGTGYCLGADLEQDTHTAFASDADSGASYCTGFDGADDDDCSGAATGYCYDIRD